MLVPTAEDAREVRRRVPAAKVRVVPFGMIEAEGTGLSDPNERDSTRLLFIGNFEHAPNRDAAAWLCDEIMPTVWRAKPDVHLWLVGHAPTAAIKALQSERVTVLGDVPSVVPYLRSAALFVAPIREGAGMRMKLLEAMSSGIAVVTTSLGARGLDATAGQDLILADDAASFADSIVSALDAPAWRAQLGASGHRLVSSGARRAERAAALEAALA